MKQAIVMRHHPTPSTVTTPTIYDAHILRTKKLKFNLEVSKTKSNKKQHLRHLINLKRIKLASQSQQVNANGVFDKDINDWLSKESFQYSINFNFNLTSILCHLVVWWEVRQSQITTRFDFIVKLLS